MICTWIGLSRLVTTLIMIGIDHHSRTWPETVDINTPAHGDRQPM
jgi:hypothetical protein